MTAFGPIGVQAGADALEAEDRGAEDVVVCRLETERRLGQPRAARKLRACATLGGTETRFMRSWPFPQKLLSKISKKARKRLAIASLRRLVSLGLA